MILKPISEGRGVARYGIPHLVAAVRRPVAYFTARQALDVARRAAARLERVPGIRRRLHDAIDTAMDAVLLASRARCAAGPLPRTAQAQKCRLDRYERAVEPVVRDHDAAVRRETLTWQRQHEREREWQKVGARARRGCPRPRATRPARRADTASRRAPLPTPRGDCAGRAGRRPVRRLDPCTASC